MPCLLARRGHRDADRQSRQERRHVVQVGLGPPLIGVPATVGKELLMRALGDHPAVLQLDDPVESLQARQPVGDEQQGVVAQRFEALRRWLEARDYG